MRRSHQYALRGRGVIGYERKSASSSLLEELVHDFGTLGKGWPDLVAVDALGHRRAAVANQPCDVLQGYVVGAEQANEGA